MLSATDGQEKLVMEVRRTIIENKLFIERLLVEDIENDNSVEIDTERENNDLEEL